MLRGGFERRRLVQYQRYPCVCGWPAGGDPHLLVGQGRQVGEGLEEPAGGGGPGAGNQKGGGVRRCGRKKRTLVRHPRCESTTHLLFTGDHTAAARTRKTASAAHALRCANTPAQPQA